MHTKLFSIVGYGTFITRGYWKDKLNVQVCLVKNFTRIFPIKSWFPYVLPSKHSFWALKFNVNSQQLDFLDGYEGVSANLFKREITDTQFKNGKNSTAFIYVPTENLINKFDLTLNLDKEDKWKEEIKKIPEIINKFPELVL